MPPANTPGKDPVTPSFIEKLSPADLQVLAAFVNDQIAARGGDGHTDALGAISKSQESLARIVGEIQRSNNRENKDYEDRSVFNYDPSCEWCKTKTRHPTEDGTRGMLGHPKAKLTHEVMFCNGIMREEWLTPMEIELCNAFTESTTAREGQWTATIERDGTRKRLAIAVPYRGMDARNGLPSLSAILLELRLGAAVVDPLQQIHLIAELGRRVKELETKLAASAA